MWLIGAGPMAEAYVRVLEALDCEFRIVGRSEISAAQLEARTGREVERGGLEAAIIKYGSPVGAIVSTSIETLSANAIALMESGCSRILVEKPAGLNGDEIRRLGSVWKGFNSKLYVAYNRRFYASVDHLCQLVAADGGVKLVNFDFSELSERVSVLEKSPLIKSNWFLANSTHVVDLAFYIAGTPVGRFNATTSGELDWHPTSSRFAGSGESTKGALFSYAANWGTPGRWGLEVHSVHRRFLLRPMEQLWEIHSAFEPPVEIEIDDRYDRLFKPGVLQQVKAFLSTKEDGRLCSIADHLLALPHHERIAGYSP
ncbi:Predicted dehydrogenase [Fulvimarina pelagi HTCC2506]|uniref:Predicted dehydrogenase n=1 Tax=Fulvimarina pelagi HTCC2506 TaxID=314231 RepID=Q0G1S1_9HYPH|nr:Predicted dehydrogenase [Fulvimarina pelagi HTCC2506]